MKFDKLSEKRNDLLKRKDIIIKMNYEKATPSKAVLQGLIAKDFKAEVENVEISKIISDHGRAAGKVWIKIWDDKKVGIYKTKADAKKEAEAPKETPKEEKKEEAPKKEVKEESPKEEKKEEPKKEKPAEEKKE